MSEYEDYQMDQATIEDDTSGGGYDNSQSAPPTQNEQTRTGLRLIFFKPRPNFDPNNIRTKGYAFNFNLAQHGNYNAVMLQTAIQNAPQTQERGKSCFAWRDDATTLRFKMEVVDISTALLVLRYKRGLSELVHKKVNNGTNTLQILTMTSVQFRADEAAKAAIANFANGEHPYRPSKENLDPLAINLRLSKQVGQGNQMFHMIRLTGGEALALETFFTKALIKLMEKDSEWTPRS